MNKPNHRQHSHSTTLRFLDLDQAKTAVTASLRSTGPRRSYEHAIAELIDWYCSEPRLGFNKVDGGLTEEVREIRFDDPPGKYAATGVRTIGRGECEAARRRNRPLLISSAPIRHQLQHRADAHILIAFLAYCVQVTLKQRLLLHAPGLTPTAVLEKLAEIKMIDVWIPTVDQRWLILPRYTQPSLDSKLLIEKLKLQLASQPPPRLVPQKQSYEIKAPTVR